MNTNILFLRNITFLMAILGEANKIFANQNEYFELVYRLVTEEYYVVPLL